MTTQATSLFTALLGAFFFGISAVLAWMTRSIDRTTKKKLRQAMGVYEQIQPRQVAGLKTWLLRVIEEKSSTRHLQRAGMSRQQQSSIAEKTQMKIVRAGMHATATVQGVRTCQRTGVFICATLGGVIGSLFTPALAVLTSLGGLVAGIVLPLRALDTQALIRKQELERGLSQTLEVICLGLRAGLSFDRALALYCKSFESTFSTELKQGLRLWQAGIVTREQALRSLAETYDSPLLGRVVDNIVRALRFGSPLAESLEVLAVEARGAHRACVQEAVMKAPVKMMVPVGALILPSMLILVLGPVLLDLISGF